MELFAAEQQRSRRQSTRFGGVTRRLLGMVAAAGLVVSQLAAPVTAAPSQPPSTAVTWKYTALGDSLGTGFLAQRGYVPRYQTYMQTDTGSTISLSNLSQNGWTSTDLLNALRTNATFRNAVSSSQVVTWDIGGNDLRAARDRYKARTCGGTDNQDCLRATRVQLKANWDAIVAEILALRSTSTTIIRTMDAYNPYVDEDKAADTWAADNGLNDFQAFKPYVDEAAEHVRLSAAANNIPYAKVYAAFNGPNGDIDPHSKGYLAFDGLHPNDTGHKVIADLLRGLGYAPLK